MTLDPPKIRRVNLDSSWLVQYSIHTPFWPKSSFNLLVDPWLDSSPQIDYAKVFSVQSRGFPSIASSVVELEELLRVELKEEKEIDDALRTSDVQCRREIDEASHEIDAILISHPFTDHAHPETLQEDKVPHRIPYLCTSQAYPALRALVGKRRRIAVLDKAKPGTEEPPQWLCAVVPQKGSYDGILPPQLHILDCPPRERIFGINRGMAWSQLHGAILIISKQSHSPKGKSDDCGTILYSPHGISPSSIPRWLSVLTNRSKARHALIMAFDRQAIPLIGSVALGFSGVVALVCRPASTKFVGQLVPYQANYVLSTHDEHKMAGGLVATVIKRSTVGFEGGNVDMGSEMQGRAQKMLKERFIKDGGEIPKALVLNTEQQLQI